MVGHNCYPQATNPNPALLREGLQGEKKKKKRGLFQLLLLPLRSLSTTTLPVVCPPSQHVLMEPGCGGPEGHH